MGAIDTAFKAAFRDYVTDGVAGSGANNPAKADLRGLGATIEAYFAAPWTLSANVTVTAPTSAPAGYVQRWLGASTNANQFLLMDGYGGIPGFRTRRSNVTGSAESAIQNNDVIATWDIYGYGATGMSSGPRAQIRAVATQTWTDTAQGAKFIIATAANGGTTLSDRITIDQDGTIITLGTLNVSASLRISGIQYSTTTTGGTINLSAATPILIHEVASAQSTMTINLPSSPSDGQMQSAMSLNGITTTTWGNGTVAGTVALSANAPVTLIYRSASSKWYRIQ